MATRGRWNGAAVVAAIVLFSGVVYSQVDRGVISGAVQDLSGAGVPGAKVSAVNVNTNVTNTVQSNAVGDFAIPALPAGTYKLTVEREGFKTFVQSGIDVAAGGESRIAVKLELGLISQSVEIKSNAEQLQTANATNSVQVNNQFVDELPLVVGGAMRNPFDLAAVTPVAKDDAAAPQGSDTGFFLGGGQAASFGITLDGVSVNITRYSSVSLASVNTPSLEAITEFTVQSNGFKAEYGRAAGGTMTFTSKSGTNDLHGTAYEFLRNDDFDARAFFDPARQIYKQSDFGFSAGGPVWIPKVYHGRSRTFFFGAGEWFRNRVGVTNSYLSVPTPEMYQGNFSNWVGSNNKMLPIYDPATTTSTSAGFVRTAFPGNIIPQSRFSTLAEAYLKQVGNIAYPNTGAQPGTLNYVQNNYVSTTGLSLTPWTKVDAKIDENFTANDRVAVLFHYGSFNTVPGPEGFAGLPGVLNATEDAYIPAYVWRPVYTKIIRPNIVNSLYGGYNSFAKRANVASAVGGWKAKGVCLIGALNCDIALPQVTFSDYSTWSGSAGDGSNQYTYSIGDDLTVTHGRHTLKFGFLWERLDYNGYNQANVAGILGENRLSTSVPGNSTLSTGGGNSFASLLLGQAYSGGTQSARFVNTQWRSYSWYAQDDIHLTPRLTLNLGVRYEFTLPPVSNNDQQEDFDPTKPNPAAGGIPGALVFAGFGPGRQSSSTLDPGWYRGIGPRLGLAYALDSKTAIRAGAARSFGVIKTVGNSTHYDGYSLTFSPTSTNSGVTPAFTFDQGLPPYSLPPSIDPSFSNGNSTAYWNTDVSRLPEEFDWTFSIQRQLSPSTLVEAAYNGTVGTHLEAAMLNLNQLPFSYFQKYGLTLLNSSITSAAAVAAGIPVPYPGFAGSVAQALRRFPQYLTIDTAQGEGDRTGHSTYHAMVLQISHRLSYGFTLQGSYSLSKMLSNADSTQVTAITSLDQYDRSLEKSISGFDQMHFLRGSWVYDLPFGQGKRWLSQGKAARLIGGWHLAGILTAASGLPIGLSNSNNYGIFNNRSPITVNTYDGWEANLSNPNWFGSSTFFQPTSYFGPQPTNVLGNETRYNPSARYPWSYGNNLSLGKSFSLHKESMHLDFRAEAFNMINLPRFGIGSTNITSSTFGVVRSQLNSPRQLQLALKLYY